MRVVILYHPKSEHEGKVIEFSQNYKRLKGKEIQLISLETVDGAQMARLYDITRYPALLAIEDNGQLQKLWQGGELPLLDELEYYTKT